MNLLHISALLIGLAAVGGLTMAGIRFTKNINPPDWMPLVHGLVAATGVALLGYVAWQVGLDNYGRIALGLFIVAAAGGLFLNQRFHRRGITLPIPFMLIHAGVAVLAFALLLLSIFAPAV